MKPRLLCALALIVLGAGLASFDAAATQSGTVNIISASAQEVIYINRAGKPQTLLLTVCNDAASTAVLFVTTASSLGVVVANVIPDVPEGYCETASHEVAAGNLIMIFTFGGVFPVTGTYQIEVLP
jgi:hypothetical protein